MDGRANRPPNSRSPTQRDGKRIRASWISPGLSGNPKRARTAWARLSDSPTSPRTSLRQSGSTRVQRGGRFRDALVDELGVTADELPAAIRRIAVRGETARAPALPEPLPTRSRIARARPEHGPRRWRRPASTLLVLRFAHLKRVRCVSGPIDWMLGVSPVWVGPSLERSRKHRKRSSDVSSPR